jgi:hypothetical protein
LLQAVDEAAGQLRTDQMNMPAPSITRAPNLSSMAPMGSCEKA